MEMLRQTFLESPVLVYVTCGLAELVTAAVWHKTRAARARTMLIVWPALAVAVGILAAFVQTDREKIHATWSELRAAMDEGDVDRLMGSVAPGFAADRLDRARLRELAEQAREVLEAKSVKVAQFAIKEIAGDRATAEIVAWYEGPDFRTPATQWRLTFARQAGGAWPLGGVRCTKPAGLDLGEAVRGLRRWSRARPGV